MKIVISGATGNIGQQLLAKLNLAEHEYVLITRDKTKLSTYQVLRPVSLKVPCLTLNF